MSTTTINGNITGEVIEFDVRPILENAGEPLKDILQKIGSLGPGQILKIINSFKPSPLITLLAKQGYDSYVETPGPDIFLTYFYRKENTVAAGSACSINTAGNSCNIKPVDDWDNILKRFEGKLQMADVRQLAMPLPMMTILEKLDELPTDEALFVYHKRIPVFLIPELSQRKFSYRIREISDSEVHIVIFKE